MGQRSNSVVDSYGNLRYYSFEACTTPPRNQCTNYGRGSYGGNGVIMEMEIFHTVAIQAAILDQIKDGQVGPPIQIKDGQVGPPTQIKGGQVGPPTQIIGQEGPQVIDPVGLLAIDLVGLLAIDLVGHPVIDLVDHHLAIDPVVHPAIDPVIVLV